MRFSINDIRNVMTCPRLFSLSAKGEQDGFAKSIPELNTNLQDVLKLAYQYRFIHEDNVPWYRIRRYAPVISEATGLAQEHILSRLLNWYETIYLRDNRTGVADPRLLVSQGETSFYDIVPLVLIDPCNARGYLPVATHLPYFPNPDKNPSELAALWLSSRYFGQQIDTIESVMFIDSPVKIERKVCDGIGRMGDYINWLFWGARQMHLWPVENGHCKECSFKNNCKL
jgi:hypothetical protein